MTESEAIEILITLKGTGAVNGEEIEAIDVIEEAMFELEQYRAIGVVEVIDKCLKKLGQYENAQEKIEKRIQEIKANENYPHNFMGQMVDDFEWTLKLLKQ